VTYGHIDGFRRLQRNHEINGNPNGTAYFGPALDSGTNPIRIRIVKSGGLYQAYLSLDGTRFSLLDALSAALPVAYVGLGAFHSEPFNQSIPVDFGHFEVKGASGPPYPATDTMPPTGAIHADTAGATTYRSWYDLRRDGGKHG
jgi:hypothetical protein